MLFSLLASYLLNQKKEISRICFVTGVCNVLIYYLGFPDEFTK